MKTLISALVVSLFTSATALALDTGSEIPEFKLQSVDGKEVSISDYKDKVVVLEWFNDQCPFVKKHYGPKAMQSLQKKWTEKGVVWLTIDSTNPSHQNFKDQKALAALVKSHGLGSTALLADPEGTVGKLFGAKTTPHIFIKDKAGKVAYQGAIDDNPDAFSNPSEASNYVDLALAQILEGKKVVKTETSPYGCSVKY